MWNRDKRYNGQNSRNIDIRFEERSLEEYKTNEWINRQLAEHVLETELNTMKLNYRMTHN